MKKYQDMQITAKEHVRFKVRFRLNGIHTQGMYDTFEEITQYLDSLVRQGGHVDDVCIFEKTKIIFE